MFAEKFDSQSIDRYRTDGYFVVRKLLNEQEVQQICERITYIVDNESNVPASVIRYEEAVKRGELQVQEKELGVRKLHGVAMHDPFFRQLAFHPRLLEIARALIGSEIALMQSMTLMKPPRVSTPKVWHQDNAYFLRTPCDLFGFWIACDRATVENGCMHLVPGSHLQGIVVHAGAGDEFGIVETPSPDSVVAIPLDPGDALIFHGQLFHYTPANQTELRRRAVQYHYVSRNTNRLNRPTPFDLQPELVIE